jgi:hypothetical protein
VEVGREVQRRAEALDEGDRTALPFADAEGLPRAPALIRENRAQEGAENLGGQSRVPGAAIAEQIRKRENPLTHRNFRQHPVDQMGRSVRHPPSTTRRTESPAFTREGDETVVAACITVDANKAVRQHAALDVGADLSLYEMCHRGAVPLRSGEEGLELVPDDFV